jgi:hypothetical protein
MLAQLGPILAAIGSAAEAIFGIRCRTLVGMAVTAVALGGCLPAAVPLAGADPADPGAKVAGVGYRSTITPYTSLRPSTPAPWRERNDGVAPQPKLDR